MWVKCNAEGEKVDEDVCKFLWRPRPTWGNARDAEVVAIQLQSFPARPHPHCLLIVYGIPCHKQTRER
jgi:hypothetical protein